MKIERRIFWDQEVRDEVKEYRVTTAADAAANGDQTAANQEQDVPETGKTPPLEQAKMGICGYSAARAAANDAANKTLYAANAANGVGIFPHGLEQGFCEYLGDLAFDAAREDRAFRRSR